ncbi:thiamine phosphate synthase [Lacibacter luteus]|uniref:Thiamine phosphate synthase n=1 Tax=Lacibacter luteus TaxID=2508719 RepID=A0A4V1M7H8_9BACT|nr:thiamine phosphate synthase [Lacibacter luteus]RXK59922.1 thiamine phosphate synthase [Lacibacter luteus]
METKINNGVYLVVDPSIEQQQLFEHLAAALEQGIAAVQLWDHFPNENAKQEIIPVVCAMCKASAVPVLINNDWQLLKMYPLDGVHFDALPEKLTSIKNEIGRNFLVGVTVNNDLSVVEQAEANKLDYISFCSIFPSSTSNSCELVSFDTIRKARAITAMPIFLAGGIRLDNISKLSELDYNGVAIVSGIMKADDPAAVTKQYNQLLKK